MPILHIGMPKTATTALQKYVFTDEKYFFPIGRYGAGGDSCRSELVSNFLWSGLFLDKYSYEKNNDLYKEEFSRLLRAAENASKVPVISQEAITIPTFFNSDFDVVFSRLREVIGDAIIFLTIRNQADFLKSFYSTLVTDMGSSISFQDFIYINTEIPNHRVNVARCLDYKYVFDTLSGLFSHIEVLVYEHFVLDPLTYLNRILTRQGITLDKFENVVENASRDEEQLAYARSFNEHCARGLSVSIDDFGFLQTSPEFRRILAKVKSGGELSRIEAKIYNDLARDGERQQLAMHRKEDLIYQCKLLGLAPKPANDYHINSRWLVDTFGQSNASLMAERGINLNEIGYPVAKSSK